MNETLHGTFYVICDGSSCKTAINTAKEFSGFVNGFRVDKHSKGHGADVIIHVKVQDEKQLMDLGNKIKSSASGIKGVQPSIEIPEYKNT